MSVDDAWRIKESRNTCLVAFCLATMGATMKVDINHFNMMFLVWKFISERNSSCVINYPKLSSSPDGWCSFHAKKIKTPIRPTFQTQTAKP